MSIPNIFKALSDPLRRDVLTLLKSGAMSAGDIASKLEVTPAALSYHLNILKKCDLIIESKEKNFIFYELNATLLDELILWLNNLRGG